MSYFGSANYYAGDPGLGDTLKRIGSGIVKYGGAAIGLTPIGRGAKVLTTVAKVAALAGAGSAVTKLATTPLGGLGPQAFGPPIPGIKGAIERFLPGGATGYAPRRRRMQFTNQKALNRAIRRVSGFGNLVKRSKKSIAKANRALNPSTGARKAPARKR